MGNFQNVIEDHVKRGRQSWTRQVTVKEGGAVLRATVHRDSYDFQSDLYSEVYSPEQKRWNRLQSLSGTDYGHLPSYVTKDELEINEATDDVVHSLLAYAVAVAS
jgi:hypothetical protein